MLFCVVLVFLFLFFWRVFFFFFFLSKHCEYAHVEFEWRVMQIDADLVGKSAGLVIERLRVRIAAGAAGEFSSPGLILCADSYSVSVPSPCYCSGTEKTPVILPKVQVADYT